MGYATDALLWFGVDLGEHSHVIENTVFQDPQCWLDDGASWFADHGLTGVVVVQHGHSDIPRYGLGIDSTVSVVPRSAPKTLDARFPEKHPIGTLRLYIEAALDLLRIERPTVGIGWVVAAYTGA